MVLVKARRSIVLKYKKVSEEEEWATTSVEEEGPRPVTQVMKIVTTYIN